MRIEDRLVELLRRRRSAGGCVLRPRAAELLHDRGVAALASRLERLRHGILEQGGLLHAQILEFAQHFAQRLGIGGVDGGCQPAPEVALGGGGAAAAASRGGRPLGLQPGPLQVLDALPKLVQRRWNRTMLYRYVSGLIEATICTKNFAILGLVN